MSRRDPGPIVVYENDIPRAKLNREKIRLRLAAAKVGGNRQEVIFEALQQLMDSYCLRRMVEQQHSPTPSELREYAGDVRKAVTRLQLLLATNGNLPHPNRAASAVFEAICYSDDAQFEINFTDNLSDSLDQFAAAVESSVALSPDKTISGKVEQADRQRLLATNFIEFCKTFGLSTSRRGNGVMLQLFRECIHAVGETQTNPARLFRDVIELDNSEEIRRVIRPVFVVPSGDS